VIPCDHIEAQSKRYYSHVIYSDDHGATWKLGGTSPRDQVNECEVVELTDGRLLLNMRNYDKTQQSRQQAFSRDGGLTWEDQSHIVELIEPICQASIRRHESGALLFSNPAAKTRTNLLVRVSTDEARTWRELTTLHAGPAAYSCLLSLSATEAACLYERGEKKPYEKITCARFSVK
jgi:sialidase-1